MKLQWSFYLSFCNYQNTVSPSKVPPIINEEREKLFRGQFWALAAGSWTMPFSNSAYFPLLIMERSGSSALWWCSAGRWFEAGIVISFCKNTTVSSWNWSEVTVPQNFLDFLTGNASCLCPIHDAPLADGQAPCTWVPSWVAESKESLCEDLLNQHYFFCFFFMTGNGLNSDNVRETKEAKLKWY